MIQRQIIWLSLLLAATTQTIAQKGFYIPQHAKIFFAGDTSTIFSNVINTGQLGVGKKATVNFKGKKWENDQQALITDDSNNGNGVNGQGGTICFLTPDSYSLPQLLTGGYNAATHTGATFYNLIVATKYGISLTDASTKIRNQLHFKSGNVYVNDQTLNIGDNSPGIISGYTDKKFIVTGKSGGVLLREKISSINGIVVFPVGVADGKYAPAAIRMQSNKPDDFYVRVIDNIKEDVSSGADLSANSVNKTWQIGKLLRPGQDQVQVLLQHLLMEEGNKFFPNRNKAYLSQYVNNKWDTGALQTAPLSPAFITSGIALTNSGVNSRSFTGTITNESYFSKFAYGPIDTSRWPTTTRDFRIWPNPTSGLFYINIGDNDRYPAHTIVIWTILGQKVREELVNDRPLIQMRGLISGTYIVGLISNIGEVIEAKKLIVY